MVTDPTTPHELLNLANELEATAERLRAIAQRTMQGTPNRDEEAVLALTDAGRDLVRYLLTQEQERADYGKALEDLGITGPSLGGVVGGIKRRELAKMPPVVDYELIEGTKDDWRVLINQRYVEAARKVL
ncbi:hypothetical protein JKP75_09710 [Blastococcus sp. TML/M2B]|uniref:hypothetical protein n=1 Tax=unclassified Blastococcus TaxID=2619396 RepID=UPI00190A4C12|nr:MULTISPECIES: hypothetical protein [unclassified Blastococcus]MBN1092808.1 hypothetical protein [Blastococcus sp. TML/M2B]MBN1097085.1 hypothetical protein [Blastococcus sp. TML/C7B]